MHVRICTFVVVVLVWMKGVVIDGRRLRGILVCTQFIFYEYSHRIGEGNGISFSPIHGVPWVCFFKPSMTFFGFGYGWLAMNFNENERKWCILAATMHLKRRKRKMMNRKYQLIPFNAIQEAALVILFLPFRFFSNFPLELILHFVVHRNFSMRYVEVGLMHFYPTQSIVWFSIWIHFSSSFLIFELL